MDKVIFIDRDGVINWDPIGDYIKKVEDFKYIDGVLESLRKLSVAGYRVVVISNQAGIGDGVYKKQDLDIITDTMVKTVAAYGGKIDGVYHCLHGKNEGCSCRKPETGLFVQAANDFSFDKQQTFFIGDKVSDIVAGKRFGLKTILVRTGHGSTEEKKLTDDTRPDTVVADLAEAVKIVLGGNTN